MRQCERCHSYSSDDQYCSNCGNRFAAGQTLNSATTTPIPGPPPEVPRKRKASALIPGLSAFLPYRDSQSGQWGCIIISIILAALLTFGGFQLFHTRNTSPQSPSSAAHLSVINSNNIVHGGSIHIRGNNFPPYSTVGVTVDGGAPSAFRSISVPVSVQHIFVHEEPLHPLDYTVVVRSDGTFDTTIPVPASWVPGSRHTIQATTQNTQASTQASIDVVTQPPGQPSNAPQPVSPTVPSQPGAPQPGVPQPAVSTPMVSNVNPQKGPVDGGTQVTITGTGFTNATSVSFDSASIPCGGHSTCVVNSDTQIIVASPAGSGTVDVTVTTPNGTSTKSSAYQFTYIPPSPTVSSVDPSGGLSSGGTSVTINGTDFTGATSVAFGSAAIQCSSGDTCTINNDGTQMTVTSPAESSSDAIGPVDVTVTTAGGTSPKSSADQFTYANPPADPSADPPVGSPVIQ
jgi:IPT/TIG domain